jgi:hypothetical protein
MVLATPRTRLPSAICGINWGHPLLKSVDFILAGCAAFWNPCNRLLSRSTLGKEQSSSSAGPINIYDGTQYINYLELSGFGGTATGGVTPWTIAGVFVPTAAVVNGSPVAGTCETPGSSTQDRQILYSSTGGNWEAYLTDGSAKRARTSVVPAVGRPDSVIATTNGTTLVCSVGPGIETATAVTSNGHNAYVSAEFCVGNSNAVGSSGTGVALLIRARRYWNESDRALFHANPAAIFAPLPRRVYVQPTGVTFNAAWNVAANTVIQTGARVA